MGIYSTGMEAFRASRARGVVAGDVVAVPHFPDGLFLLFALVWGANVCGGRCVRYTSTDGNDFGGRMKLKEVKGPEKPGKKKAPGTRADRANEHAVMRQKNRHAERD